VITVRARGVGAVVDDAYRASILATSSPYAAGISPTRSLDPSKILGEYATPLSLVDPSTRRAITASQAPVEALRPECTEGCSADSAIAADPEVLARCISICTSTHDLELAKRNASRGAFCRQVIEAATPSLGPALRSDYSTLWAQCQDDPDAFLARLRAQGIDLGVSFEPWLKRNWKLVAIGGAALLGLLVVRKLRG